MRPVLDVADHEGSEPQIRATIGDPLSVEAVARHTVVPVVVGEASVEVSNEARCLEGDRYRRPNERHIGRRMPEDLRGWKFVAACRDRLVDLTHVLGLGILRGRRATRKKDPRSHHRVQLVHLASALR